MYINPDEIEATIRRGGQLALAPYRLTATGAEIRDYFAASPFLQSHGLVASDIQSYDG